MSVKIRKKIEWYDCIEHCSNSIKRVTSKMSVEISNVPKGKKEKRKRKFYQVAMQAK